MRLEDARESEVVRNRRNGRFYRFVRREGNRVRIRPLELFPNGLLIEKTADTIVDADLEVDMVGSWSDELYVEVPDELVTAWSESCEAELKAKREQLILLKAEMPFVDPHKHGGRGSHINKIQSVEWRVEVLERGLAVRTEDVTAVKTETTTEAFDAGAIVQLPSCLPALVLGYEDGIAQVRLRYQGELMEAEISPEALRPWRARSLATV